MTLRSLAFVVSTTVFSFASTPMGATLLLLGTSLMLSLLRL